MPRIVECPKCGADISDSHQLAEDDLGVGGGWYCEACDVSVADEHDEEDYE
jgi:hypothetical protein